MDYEILYQPSYSLARIAMKAGEAITAEAGAMVSMSQGITVVTEAKGGLLSGIKRSFLGGESFFLNTFKATSQGEITLAPPLPGDIVHFQLNGETIFVQSSSYMASSPDISVDTKWAGAKGFFAKEGLFLLKIQGTGDVFLSSYGAIHLIQLGQGESYTIDNGHMVAFDQSVTYKVKRVGGLKSTLFSGEGLVCSFTGPGRLFMQTRSEDAFLSWLIPHLPKERGSSGGGRGVSLSLGR